MPRPQALFEKLQADKKNFKIGDTARAGGILSEERAALLPVEEMEKVTGQLVQAAP